LFVEFVRGRSQFTVHAGFFTGGGGARALKFRSKRSRLKVGMKFPGGRVAEKR